jgi:hypothetical protein
MPLGKFEREVLRVIAANRNPDSYVGGATVLLAPFYIVPLTQYVSIDVS